MCDKKELKFSIFILYSLAEKWKMSPPEVYKILNSTGIFDNYVIKCYDVLHTQGKEYLVEDITDFVREKGVNVWLYITAQSRLKKSGCNAFEKVFGFWSRILSYELWKSGKKMGGTKGYETKEDSNR